MRECAGARVCDDPSRRCTRSTAQQRCGTAGLAHPRTRARNHTFSTSARVVFGASAAFPSSHPRVEMPVAPALCSRAVETWELTAREQIRDLVAAYAHCADSGRFDALVALFADDGVLETPDGQHHGGADAIRAFLTGTKTRLAAATSVPLIAITSRTCASRWRGARPPAAPPTSWSSPSAAPITGAATATATCATPVPGASRTAVSAWKATRRARGRRKTEASRDDDAAQQHRAAPVGGAGAARPLRSRCPRRLAVGVRRRSDRLARGRVLAREARVAPLLSLALRDVPGRARSTRAWPCAAAPSRPRAAT